MRRISQLVIVSGTAAAIALGATAGANAAVAQPATKPKLHEFTFTKKHESFKVKNLDKVGDFNAQVKLHGKISKKYPMGWSFKITNKKLKAIARSKMNCTADIEPGSYHDNHPSIPVGYTWHSVVPKNALKKIYLLHGTCIFRVKIDGKPGTAYVGFAFRYKIDPNKKTKAATVSSGVPTLTTSVRIAA